MVDNKKQSTEHPRLDTLAVEFGHFSCRHGNLTSLGHILHSLNFGENYPLNPKIMYVKLHYLALT